MAISINSAWCKGCGICAAFCPKKALTVNEKTEKAMHDVSLCIECGLCEIYCPDLAIELVKTKKKGKKDHDAQLSGDSTEGVNA